MAQADEEKDKVMLIEKMYVRCPIDIDMINPRDFIMGQIKKIDSFADTAEVVFHDPYKYRIYYDGFPESALLPTAMVQRCQFFEGAMVRYARDDYKVVSCIVNPDGLNEYYIENSYDKELIRVTEDKITAPFTVGKVDPASQLQKYEF